MHWGHPQPIKVALFCADIVIALLAMLGSLVVLGAQPVHAVRSAVVSLLFALILLSIYYIFDLYDLASSGKMAIGYRFGAALLAIVIVTDALSFLVPALFGQRACVLAGIGFAGAASGLVRLASRRRSGFFVDRAPILIVGRAQDARALAVRLPEDVSFGLVGFFGEEETTRPARLPERRRTRAAGATALQVEECASPPIPGVRYLGPAQPELVEDAVKRHKVQFLVVNRGLISARLATLLGELRLRGIHIYSVPDFCMRLSEELPLDLLSDDWLSFSGPLDMPENRVLRRLKRLGDLFLAAISIALSSPLMLLTALAVKVDSPGPALFLQVRVGWKGRPFRLLKFRSMRQNAETHGPQWAQVDDPRITRLGKWIRKFRIDELPQLFNVLAGQMSFVGPRPERPEFVSQLGQQIPFYHLRHYLSPGITGWAQVKYPYGASVEDARRKLQYDLYYIRNASLIVDLRILLRTIRTVLFLEGSR